MEELKLVNGKAVMDSRDVAKMVDKRHTNLIRDIARYISVISTESNLSSLDFFIKSNYEDAKGEVRKCYLLTKQGCEFVANKMTGKKGTLFTARYVNLFNQYEDNQRRLTYQNPEWPIPATYAEALQLAANLFMTYWLRTGFARRWNRWIYWRDKRWTKALKNRSN